MRKQFILKISAALAVSAILATTASANLDKCAGCHGKDWSKNAMNASKKVSEMSQESIAEALKGYRDGTYGGKLKTLMRNQVPADADVNEMAREVFYQANPVLLDADAAPAPEPKN